MPRQPLAGLGVRLALRQESPPRHCHPEISYGREPVQSNGKVAWQPAWERDWAFAKNRLLEMSKQELQLRLTNWSIATAMSQSKTRAR